ncbi:MAG: peptidoglycan DD-metalloendopeptidase family protein [Cyanobacteria bacterium]|nr:peptidoglycan DD-metalloendopeptidase family protein [Cyanobacteriota bacterium]
MGRGDWRTGLGRMVAIALLVLLGWVGGPVGGAWGQTTPEIEALRQQQQQLLRQRQGIEAQRQQLERQGDRLAGEEERAKAQRDRLDQSLQETQARLDRNRDRIQAAANRLQELERDLAAAEQTYGQSRQAAIARLRFLQRQSPQWGLAVLLQSKSPNQFLDRRQQLERVYEADRQQLVTLNAAASGLEIQRMRLRDQQRELAAIARELNVEESQLQITVQQQTAVADRLTAQRQKAESDAAQLAQDSATMAALIQAKAKQQVALEAAERERLARLERERLAQLAQARSRGSGGGRISRGGGGRWVASGRGELAIPVVGPLTSGFGWRVHPILGRGRFHNGLDFGAPHGSTIRAAHGGRVIVAGWFGGYGKTVVIDRGDGLSTLYGHASEIWVNDGDVVEAGQAIAAVGSTGLSTGPHLHFEVRRDGQPVDPSSFL